MALRKVKDDGNHGETCTCDGGPYIHGPVGQALVLAAKKIKPPKEGEKK